MKPVGGPRTILVVTIVCLGLAAVFFLLDADWLLDAALIASAVVPLIPLIGDIVTKLRQRQPGVDVIALIAVTAGLALGEFLTAAIVGLMLATGQALEEYAAGRAQRELTALVGRAPRTAHRMTGDTIETIDVDEVVTGDRLLVKTGEVIPVDGVILSHSALLDESALTGEPIPVEKQAGDLISSGVVNAQDAFELSATAEAADSTYAGIVRLVEQARQSRAPSMRLADRWAGWFVPFTLGVAAAAWVASGDPVRAFSVLVVATPCPLLLAVPIAVVAGISRGARRGIIFRGGGPLEALAQTQNVLIDKTGTLTVGRPALRSIHIFDDQWTSDEILRLSASVDQTSAHILARAIVEAAHDHHLELGMPERVAETPGSGMTASLDDRRVALGKLAWLLDGRPEPGEVTAFRRRMTRLAPTAVYVAVDDVIAAALVFDDQIRPDAAHTVRALRRIGVDKVVMATGDHPVVARTVGIAVGVDDVMAETTPREKMEVLEELQVLGVTTMVGDGINDAPALAAADVGVAMGARGATASSEAADVVLMEDRLQRLVDAIGIAQRSRRIATESVVIGMGLSLVAMGAASFGLLVPLVGALLQEGIDIVAIVNALRALGGNTPSESGPRLPFELSQSLRSEHDRLIPRLDSIRATADSLDSVTPEQAVAALKETQAFLTEEILPHEANDEEEIYPLMTEILPGDDPLATMSRTHREIFHLVDVLQRQMSDLQPSGPDPADIRDLRRTLYGLHAILRLHFDQEEELYLTLHDSQVTR
jgi:heavy metal translocating P-type ATPase